MQYELFCKHASYKIATNTTYNLETHDMQYSKALTVRWLRLSNWSWTKNIWLHQVTFATDPSGHGIHTLSKILLCIYSFLSSEEINLFNKILFKQFYKQFSTLISKRNRRKWRNIWIGFVLFAKLKSTNSSVVEGAAPWSPNHVIVQSIVQFCCFITVAWIFCFFRVNHLIKMLNH